MSNHYKQLVDGDAIKKVNFVASFKSELNDSDSEEEDDFFTRNTTAIPLVSPISNLSEMVCDEIPKFESKRGERCQNNKRLAANDDDPGGQNHSIPNQNKLKECDNDDGTINVDDFVSCEVMTTHSVETPWTEKPFERTCLFCRASFKDKLLFLMHDDVCLDGRFKKKMAKDYCGPKIYFCGYGLCAIEFISKDSIVTHIKQKHLDKFVCSTCKRVHRSKEAVENHCITHATRRKIYKCKIVNCQAPSYFKNKTSVLSHLLADHFDYGDDEEEVDNSSDYDTSEVTQDHEQISDSEDEIFEEDINSSSKEQDVVDISDVILDDVDEVVAEKGSEQELVRISDDEIEEIKEKITAKNYLKFIKKKTRPETPQHTPPNSDRQPIPFPRSPFFRNPSSQFSDDMAKYMLRLPYQARMKFINSFIDLRLIVVAKDKWHCTHLGCFHSSDLLENARGHVVSDHMTSDLGINCEKCFRKFAVCELLDLHNCMGRTSRSSSETINLRPTRDQPTCFVCNMHFLSSIHLRWHNIKDHVSNGGIKMIKCHYCCSSCPETFSQYEYLSIHEYQNHYTVGMTLLCGFCDYRTQIIEHFKEHSKVCEGDCNQVGFVQVQESQYRCDKCGVVFCNVSLLADHIEAIHKGKKKKRSQGISEFHCNLCNRYFVDFNAIQSHLKSSQKHKK